MHRATLPRPLRWPSLVFAIGDGHSEKEGEGRDSEHRKRETPKAPESTEVGLAGLNFMVWDSLSKYSTTSFLIYIFHISQNCGLFTESGEFLLWHEVILSFGSPQKLAKV